MTIAEKKAALSAMVEEDSDSVLSTYLDQARAVILQYAYPYGVPASVTDVPPQYEHLQLDIAAYKLNKRGAEGETAHSENGVSRSYEDADIPKSMLRQIVPLAGVL